jgi:hypothetical protein
MTSVAFPPESINQILDVLTWALLASGLIWLITSLIGGAHRRAYNLTHAESGGSKHIQPDFLKVDTAKREMAIERGQRYEAQLAKREEATSPVVVASMWSRVVAALSALVGLAFTAVGTMQRVPDTDRAVRDLGNWDKFKALVSDHPLGAVLCVAVLASNAYIVVTKMRKSSGD